MQKRPRFPRKWSWPNGQKICFTISIPFEAFEKQSQVSLVGKPGEVDRFSLSYGDYGWKAGIWRLLNLLDDFGFKATIATNGLLAERHPEIIRTLADEGHEICAHDWANDQYLSAKRSKDEESATIARCTKVLTDASGGIRPVGWGSVAASGQDFTNALLAQQGYTWCADDVSDDLPFIEHTAHGPLVMIPRITNFTNDITSVILPRNPPSVLFENFKDTFDESYREAELGNPKLVGMTMHAHMGGRLTLLPALRRCFEYLKTHDGVYNSTHSDLAEWTFKHEGVKK
jgi:peptidoglycan/xylan/chitin deacetylase (PgdA/CDA1 family)